MLWLILYALLPPLLIPGLKGYFGSGAFEAAEDLLNVAPAAIVFTSVAYIAIAVLYLLRGGGNG